MPTIHAIKDHEGRPTFALAGALTIFEAAEARQALESLLRDHPDLALDLSDLEEIDTAGLQLLLRLKRLARKDGRSLPFLHHSAAVMQAMDLVQLSGLFGDTVVLPAGGR